MKNIHPSDEEIQQYALGAESCNKALIDHIQLCGHCRQQAMQYQLLFEGIEAQEKAVFDFDLADLVIERLPQTRPAYDRPLLYILACIITIMIGVAGYTFGNSLVNLFAYVQPVLIGLILTTTIGLTVFLGIDMYQKYKAQMKALNFY